MLKSTGLQKRNFITLTDAVRALEFLAADPNRWPSDGLINLGSSLALSIRDVADIVSRRCEAVYGFRPELVIPENAAAEAVTDFTFNVDRLAALGFQWENNVDAEVDGTLEVTRALAV